MMNYCGLNGIFPFLEIRNVAKAKIQISSHLTLSRRINYFLIVSDSDVVMPYYSFQHDGFLWVLMPRWFVYSPFHVALKVVHIGLMIVYDYAIMVIFFRFVVNTQVTKISWVEIPLNIKYKIVPQTSLKVRSNDMFPGLQNRFIQPRVKIYLVTPINF